MKDIAGKTAIVTGAGRGIGFAFVKALLAEGVNVLATSRNIKALEKMDNRHLHCFAADLLNDASFGKIISACASRFGGIDIVINNAALAKKQLLSETTPADWDAQMAVNVRAPFMLNNAAMPYLLKSDHATIVNVGSVVSTKGYVTQGAYSAAKHALLGYTKVLARETFDKGVRVHAMLPGGVATEMVLEMRPDLDPTSLSSPEEIAEVLIFLLRHREGAVIDEISIRRHTKEPWI